MDVLKICDLNLACIGCMNFLCCTTFQSHWCCRLLKIFETADGLKTDVNGCLFLFELTDLMYVATYLTLSLLCYKLKINLFSVRYIVCEVHYKLQSSYIRR